MKQVENDLLVIEAFAKACESLNEYAQQLRRDHVFPQVTTVQIFVTSKQVGG